MIEFYAAGTVKRDSGKLLRYDGVAATHAGESGCLRVAMKLDGALTCSLNLVYGVRDVRIADIRFVGSIVENDGVVVKRIAHPLLQFLLREHCSRGVIGIAEIYHVNTMVRYLRHEIVLRRAWQVVDVAPASVLQHSGTTAHHVRVDVYGIDRVGHADGIVPTYYLADVARIALSSVIDEHLRRVNLDAARSEVVLYYSFAKEVVATLGAVTVERGFRSHLVHSLVHRLDDSGAERLRYVTYAKTDDTHLRVRHLEDINLLGDVGKQIIV